MDPSLTRAAGAALDRLVLSRRDWLKGAGCLIVGFSGVGKILTSAAEAAQDLAVPTTIPIRCMARSGAPVPSPT